MTGKWARTADGSVRMVANLPGVELDAISVEVTGRVDVRGTLLIDPDVRVGFEHMTCQVTIRPTPGTDPAKLRSLLVIVELTYVNLDTLRHAITVDMLASDQVEAGGVRHGSGP